MSQSSGSSTTKTGSPERRITIENTKTPTYGEVQLIRDEEAFENAFSGHRRYSTFGWSKMKQLFCGMKGEVVYVDEDFKCVEMNMDDMPDVVSFPFEAVEKQISVVEETERADALLQLGILANRLEGAEGVDIFDLMALEPNVGSWLDLTSNRARALICGLVQLIVPIAVAVYLSSRALTSNRMGYLELRALCKFNQGWEDPLYKVLNKLVGFVMLIYVHAFINSKKYFWEHKPMNYLLEHQESIFQFICLPIWCAAGLMINTFVLAVIGLVSIIVVYLAEEPLELVLNSLALFFLADIDNYIVDAFDFDRVSPLVRNAWKQYKARPGLPVVKPALGYRWQIAVLKGLLNAVRIIVLFSPLYIVACK